MRQVPTYAIIGDGRLARHMTHYLSLLGVSYRQWSRRTHKDDELAPLLSQSTHVLVLLSDTVIVDWVNAHHAKNSEAVWVHCSAVVNSSLAFFAHPLFSFPDSLYSLEWYQRIPFFVSSKAPKWEFLLPGLSNPHHSLQEKDRALYHAYCVLANNMTVCTWQHVFSQMKERLGIDSHYLQPYLDGTFEQLKTQWQTALTGPMVRGDWETCQTDVKALSGDSFQGVLESIMKASMSEEKWREYSKTN